MKWELYTDEVKARIFELKAKGYSYQRIADVIKKEFNFPFRVDKAAIWRVYKSEFRNVIAGDKSELLETGTSKALKEREKIFKHIRSQLAKINELLWKHLHRLEEAENVLSEALKKWLEQAKHAEKIDKELMNEIRASLSHDISNISTITSQLIRQLETQAKLVGILTKPAQVRISRLDTINIINQSFRNVQSYGYYFVKPDETERKFTLRFDNKSAKEIFKELIRIGLLKVYE